MTQATPMPTEAEMNAVKDIFSRMADSIVQASQLNSEVGTLRGQVERLTQDVDNMIRRNQALDEALMQAQSERNRVREELEQTKNSLTNALNERDRLDNLRSNEMQTIDRLGSELQQAKRDRDDASFRNLELEEKLKESQARWDKLADMFFPKQEVKQEHPTGGSGWNDPVPPAPEATSEPKKDTWPF